MHKYINEEQLMVYRRMQAFGWHVKFIRRPLFQRPVCVLTDPDETTLAVIEADGTLNKSSEITLRNDEAWAVAET